MWFLICKTECHRRGWLWSWQMTGLVRFCHLPGCLAAVVSERLCDSCSLITGMRDVRPPCHLHNLMPVICLSELQFSPWLDRDGLPCIIVSRRRWSKVLYARAELPDSGKCLKNVTYYFKQRGPQREEFTSSYLLVTVTTCRERSVRGTWAGEMEIASSCFAQRFTDLPGRSCLHTQPSKASCLLNSSRGNVWGESAVHSIEDPQLFLLWE